MKKILKENPNLTLFQIFLYTTMFLQKFKVSPPKDFKPTDKARAGILYNPQIFDAIIDARE